MATFRWNNYTETSSRGCSYSSVGKVSKNTARLTARSAWEELYWSVGISFPSVGDKYFRNLSERINCNCCLSSWSISQNWNIGKRCRDWLIVRTSIVNNHNFDFSIYGISLCCNSLALCTPVFGHRYVFNRVKFNDFGWFNRIKVFPNVTIATSASCPWFKVNKCGLVIWRPSLWVLRVWSILQTNVNFQVFIHYVVICLIQTTLWSNWC